MKRIKPEKTWMNFNENFTDCFNSDWYKSIAILQDELSFSTHTFFRKHGLKTLFLPVTSNSISSPMGLGSDSSPVIVNLFGKNTYLADSMQFMLEYGCRFFEKGCFYLMPSFRGESADERHLCQFYHSEAEIVGNLGDVISLVENYVKYLCESLLEKCGNIIIKMAGNTEHITSLLNKKKFPEVSFDDAVSYLCNQNGALSKTADGFTIITSIGEKALIKKFGGVVWLKEMDSNIVPFYQAKTADNSHAKCADLLFGIGEVVGSGQRHVNCADVLSALNEHNVSPAEYSWYLKMKEKLPMETSGFGMGTERFLLWLINHNDIRDCQIVPRFNGQIIMP